MAAEYASTAGTTPQFQSAQEAKSQPGEATGERPRIDTRLLMAVAAILVVNSHLEEFYPRAWLAGDGLLGNSIFFFLAGFGLTRSELRHTRSFLSWYWRRVVRIYPSLLLVMTFFGVIIRGAWRTWGRSTDMLAEMIWPTGYTFVAMVFPFYVLFFPLLRSKRSLVLATAAFLLCFTYAAAYIGDISHFTASTSLHLSSRPLIVHTSAYFQVMIVGGLFGLRYERPRISIVWRVLATCLVFSTYVLMKYFMVTGRFARAYALLHVLTLLLCMQLFDVFCDESILVRLRRAASLWRLLSLIGGLTLEVYLVHTFIAQYHWVYSVAFPLNIVVLWVVTLPIAVVVGRLARTAQRVLNGDTLPALVKNWSAQLGLPG